jgi:hypothetical protein
MDLPRRTDSYLPAVLVGGVLLVAAALRLYGLGAESLWTDELLTLHFVSRFGPIEVLWGVPSTQPHVPLYYFLLKQWVAVVPDTDAALRFLSALFGIASVGALYLVGRRLVDWQVGVVAAALHAVSRFHLRFGQEVRMYSLLTLLTASSFYLLVRLRDRPTTRRAVAWTVSAVLVATTHVFGAFVVLAQVTYLAWRLRDLAGERLFGVPTSRLRLGYALSLLAMPVGIAGVTSLMDRVPRYHYIPWPSPYGVVVMLAEYLGYPRGTAFVVTVGMVGLFVAVAALAVVRFDGDGIGALRRPRVDPDPDPQSPGPDRDALVLAGLWFAVPFGAPIVLSYLFTPLFWPRYTIAASLGLFLLVGIGVRNLPTPSLRTVVAVLLVVALLPSVAIYHTSAQKEQWNEVGETLDRRAEPGDAVLVVDRITRFGVYRYADTERLDVTTAVAKESGTGAPPTPTAEIRDRVSGHDRVWLVLSHASESERARVIGAVNDTRTATFHEQYVGVELYLFERTPADGGADANGSASDSAASPTDVGDATNASVRPDSPAPVPGVSRNPEDAALSPLAALMIDPSDPPTDS